MIIANAKRADAWCSIVPHYSLNNVQCTQFPLLICCQVHRHFFEKTIFVCCQSDFHGFFNAFRADFLEGALFSMVFTHLSWVWSFWSTKNSVAFPEISLVFIKMCFYYFHVFSCVFFFNLMTFFVDTSGRSNGLCFKHHFNLSVF